MDLEKLIGNKSHENNLRSIYEELTSVLASDAPYNRLYYEKFEEDIGRDYKDMNEATAHNRMRKIKILPVLAEHWEDFSSLYKDNPILPKIGAEFLLGKFEFDQETIDLIKGYPYRDENLSRFNKNTNVDLGDVVPEDYEKFKNQILPSIDTISKTHLIMQKKLSRVVGKVAMARLSGSFNSSGYNVEEFESRIKRNLEPNYIVMNTIMELKDHIFLGNFTAKIDGDHIVAEFPMKSLKKENGIDIEVPTSLLKINEKNPLEFSIEGGSLNDFKSEITNKIQQIRIKSLKSDGDNNTPQPR